MLYFTKAWKVLDRDAKAVSLLLPGVPHAVTFVLFNLILMPKPPMLDLFETQSEATEADCNAYAQSIFGTSVKLVLSQGCHSYMLISDSGLL